MTTMKDVAQYFAGQDTDVIIYSGAIERGGYDEFTDILPAQKRDNLLLVLCTYGGNPDAGYRIARAAIHHYGSANFKILVPSHCKSAGTLICIGAYELIMADRAELGPLDVQLQKQDEIFQQSSGLDILRGVTYLQQEALQSFKSYLLDINGGSGLSTKIASEISSKLVIGLYEPLFAQIDPVRLGEMNAALQIAHDYGTRLNEKSKSLKSGSLRTLISEYPTHGFVIDRAEARTLFERVAEPNEMEACLAKFVNDRIWAKTRQGKPTVLDFIEFFTSDEPEGTPDDAANSPEAVNANGSTEAADQLDAPGVDAGPAGEHGEQQPSVGDEQNDAGTNEGDQVGQVAA